MAGKLVEIDRHDWPTLRDLYERNSAATFVPHNLVDNFIRWTEKQADFPNLVFYSLNGDWSDGTFAAVHGGILYTYTLATSSERLEQMLQLIDFSKGLTIHSIMNKDHAAILEVIKSRKLQLNYDWETLLHYLPAADALNFDIQSPDGIKLKSINKSDVDHADEVYICRSENPPGYLHQLAEFNPNVCAYNSDEQIVAYVFRLHNGLIGALQVDEEFYGRGLGMLLAKALSRKIAESGQDVGADIFVENKASLALFKKMGFRIVDNIYFVQTLPSE